MGFRGRDGGVACAVPVTLLARLGIRIKMPRPQVQAAWKSAWPGMKELSQDAGRYGYRLIEVIGKDKNETAVMTMRSHESFAARSKWPTVVAMVVLLGATALGWNWIWGIFFLVWSVQGIASGQAFVLQMVYRDENPVLFWVISLSWLALAVMTVVYDIFPQITPQFAADWLGAPP